MWTLRNLLLALKIRSLIHKWIVKAWWQQCLENVFAAHPGVVLICFWMGKWCNWFHWRERSVDWYCLSLKYWTACIGLLAHERQGNAQVTCLASGASFRHQCKSTAVWLLSSSRSQGEILVLSVAENTSYPWQYVFKSFFPQFKMHQLGQALLIKWLLIFLLITSHCLPKYSFFWWPSNIMYSSFIHVHLHTAVDSVVKLRTLCLLTTISTSTKK